MRDKIRKHLRRLGSVLLAAAIGGGCSSDYGGVEPDPATIAVVIFPTSVSIPQGGFSAFEVTVTGSTGFSGVVNLTVSGMPTGVTAAVSNIQTTGLVTTAFVTLDVGSSALLGSYNLVVRGTGTGVSDVTTAFSLTVAPSPAVACVTVGVLCEQWAASATASSEYSPNDWSAMQATGLPNVAGCMDNVNAWSSLTSNGVDWLELTYLGSVRPTEIRVYENFAVGSLVKAEVKDAGGSSHTVYTATAASQTCPRVLVIPVSGISAAVKVVRLSFDQRTINDWNEVDAVKLIGIKE